MREEHDYLADTMNEAVSHPPLRASSWTWTITTSELKRRCLLLFLGIVYFGVLLACYLYTIVPTHFVEGFVYRPLPEWCWMVSLGVALTPLLWTSIDFRRPSDFASLFLYICVTVPCSFMPFLASDRDPEQVVILPLLVLAAQAVFDAVRRGRLIDFPRVKNTQSLFTIIIPAAMIVLSLALWSFVGFRINVGLENVYERRIEARESLGGGFLGVLLGYGESLMLGAFLPATTVMGAITRKPRLLFAAAFSVLAVFSFDGQKAVLFGPFMLILVTVLALRSRRNTAFVLISAFLALCLLSIAQVYFFDDNSISTYIVRRVMVMPGLLADYYWEFFSSHPLVMLRDGAIGSIFSRSPYPLSTPRLIGSEFFDNPETNANTGIWLAGFAHFGYVGVFAASVLAAWLLRILDSLAAKGKYVAGCAFCTMLGLIWTNGALHTSLLSNGVVVLMLLMFLFPADIARQSIERPK
jgi:hypothetical protein